MPPANRRLFWFETSELGHLDEQSKGGHGADAGDAGQDVEASGQFGIDDNTLGDRRVDVGKLLCDQGKARLRLTLQDRLRCGFGSVARGRPVLDQRVACHVQLSEFVQRFASTGAGFQVEYRPHPSQKHRIDLVSLGLRSGRFRETPRLARVDLNQGDSAGGERLLKLPVIGASRFEDDPHASRRSYPTKQFLVPRRIVAKLRVQPVR